jgi:putative FmdB family regulatory protein
MPHYDYKCPVCEEVVEVFHRMCEKPEVRCPVCAENAGEIVLMKKQIGAGAGIIFKGSGFYETDYRRVNSGGSRANGELPYLKTEDIPAIRARVEQKRKMRKEAVTMKEQAIRNKERR